MQAMAQNQTVKTDTDWEFMQNGCLKQLFGATWATENIEKSVDIDKKLIQKQKQMRAIFFIFLLSETLSVKNQQS